MKTSLVLRVRPDPAEFGRLAGRWPMVPVWTELLGDVSTPVGVFPSLAGDGPGALLESVERSERWGRFSFVAGEPAAMVTADEGGVHLRPLARDLPVAAPRRDQPLLAALGSIAHQLRAPRLPELLPMAGGLVGFLAYEAAALIDCSPRHGEVSGSAMCFMVLDRAALFDHWRQRLLLVAHVPGESGYAAGIEALTDLADCIRSAEVPPVEPVGRSSRPLAAWPNVDDATFIESVRRVKEHILAGDIFQAVLSRRLTVPAVTDALSIYRRLRVANPSPYMFFLRTPGIELAGSSPEPLVRVQGRRVVARPIAGTCRRGATPEEDRRLEENLLADPKERAEHAMLVDLARNDLGRVCRAGSVTVTELMAVERFARVMHLVSTVEGELGEGCSALDALAAAFPAGTLTGAPKRRAMEIIAEQEPTARGPYGGVVGYLSFGGDLDVCITIRTAVVRDGLVHVQAGAGIVADSDPERELQETEEKASALLSAVAGGTT